MTNTIQLIKQINCRKSLDKAKVAIKQVATYDNKSILCKALKDKIFELENGVTLQ